jgi:hypothetical protein
VIAVLALPVISGSGPRAQAPGPPNGCALLRLHLAPTPPPQGAKPIDWSF